MLSAQKATGQAASRPRRMICLLAIRVEIVVCVESCSLFAQGLAAWGTSNVLRSTVPIYYASSCPPPARRPLSLGSARQDCESRDFLYSPFNEPLREGLAGLKACRSQHRPIMNPVNGGYEPF